MKWLARIFTWWHGQTLNTALHTLLFGKFVGKDEYGNRYYRTRKIDKALGFSSAAGGHLCRGRATGP